MTMSQLSSADFRAITTSAATALHDEWRKNRHVKAALAFGDETEGVRSGAMDINGNSWQEITPAQARAWVPRPAEAYKYDTDRDIHLAHVGGFPLQDLPPCFSKDHKVNAASCLRLLVDNVADRPVDEKNIRRFYGPKVHELWLERQLVHGSSSVPDWVQDAGLDLHYDDLDEEEQGAYNMTVRICFQALENHGFGQESELRGNIPEVGETVAGGRAFQIADDTKRLAEEDGASLRREHNGNTPKARFSPIKKPLLLANGFIAPSTLALSSEHEMAALPADTSLSSEAETKEEDEEKANDEETKLEVASAAAVRALKEAMVKSASARQALEAAVVLLEGSVETRIKRIALLVDGQEVESALAISPVEEGSGETAKHDDRYDRTVATAVTAVGMPSYRDANNDAGRQSASRRQGDQRKEEEEDAIATAAAVAEVNDALAMAQQVAEQRAAAAIRAPGRHYESETEEALDRNEGVPSAPLSDSSSYHASSTSLESQHTDTAPPLPSSDMEIEEEVRLAEAEMALEEKAEAVARALNEKREAIAREQRKFAEAQAAAVAEAEIADAVAAVEAEAAMEAKAEAVAEVMVKTQLRDGEVGSVEDTLSETTPMTTNCSAGAITGAGKAQLRRTEACFGQKGQHAAPSSNLREVGSLEDNLVHERRDKAIEFCDETKVDPSLKQLPIETTGGSINNKGGIELEALSHPAGNSNVTGDDDERPQKNIKKKKKKKKGKGT